MAIAKRSLTSCAVLVATLLMAAPAYAAIVIGTDGKPVRPQPRDASCDGPRDKRVVTFTLPPEPQLVDAVAWISSAVCKPFVLPGPLAVENRKLPLVAPERMKPEQAYRLFAGALDSVGLTIVRDGYVDRIAEVGIELPDPVWSGVVDPDTANPDSYVTALLHLKDLTPEQREQLFARRIKGEDCDCAVSPPPSDTIIITDTRSTIEHLLHRPIGR